MSLAWVHTGGYMPERRGLVFSAALHFAIIVAIILGLPQLFQAKVEDEPVIAVELINLGPKTLATQRTQTPPVPQKPPQVVEAPPPPKPAPPTPTPPPEAKPAPPPPLPEPKPAEVKPPEPKPAPVVEAKPQPPQPPQPKPKPKDANFDQILKNLAAKPLPQSQTQNQQQAKAQPSSQPIAPLGQQLSTSEIDLVKQQLIPCWNYNPGSRDAADLKPEFRVSMNADGTVRGAQLLNTDRMGDPFFRAAAESAQRALLNPTCQPLKFPPQKYDQWQTFTITFDPKDLL